MKEEKYYKVDRRIHEVWVVIAESEEDAKQKVRDEENVVAAEVWDDVLQVIDEWED